MKVTELGQFGLIDTVARMIAKSRDTKAESWKNLLIGVGDDCAVWRGENANQLAKVDCQVQGIHFNLDIISWEDLGWKALAVNLSDIAAMGGIPKYALVSLGLPLQTEVEDVTSLYRGMLKLAQQTGTAIVGGNISGSPMVFVDVTVLGKTGNPKGTYLSRSSARPGDLIAVTGCLGSSAAGLEMLTRKLKFSPSIARNLKQAFARPQPRLAEGQKLVEKGVKTAIDISDGLIADLGHICQSSMVGAVVEVDYLPIRSDVTTVFRSKSYEMALSGGEDYELLFTADQKIMEQVRNSVSQITIIGEIVAENAGQVILIDHDGKRILPRKTGWDHFKPK